MRHNEDNGLLHDAIQVVYVELSKIDDVIKKPVDQMTDIEFWAVFLRYADKPEYWDVVNQIIDKREALNVASELLMSISKDECERAIFRSRRMYQADHESDMRTAEKRGIIEVAKNLLQMNMPIDQIIAATGLSKSDIEHLGNTN